MTTAIKAIRETFWRLFNTVAKAFFDGFRAAQDAVLDFYYS